MDTLISKSTFYDTVSMIVPGFIMLFSISKIFGIGQNYFLGCALEVPYYICIFALSYICGLVIHHISRKIFDDCLKNKSYHILGGLEKLEKELKERSYIVSEYYEKYYQIIHNSHVPVIEAQVSFIRSMILVLLLICIALCFTTHKCMFASSLNLSCRSMIGILIILDIFLIKFMFYIQKKIYFSIFEDSYYLDILNAKTSLQGGGKPTEGQPSEGQPSEGQPSEGQPSEGQPSEGQPSQGQPSEGQPSEGQPSEGQPSEGQPSEGQPSEGEQAENSKEEEK